MNPDSKIFVAGQRGMVGAAVVRRLRGLGYEHLLLPSREELDLTNQAAVSAFYAEHRPQVAVICAARVGGIHANNTYPAEFIYSNLSIAQHCVHAAHAHGCERLLFLGSSCIYPREAPQPLTEASLLTGPLEPTNEAYAIAKIAGLKLCEMYRRQYGRCYHSAMPTNLYGPGDNYHPENSHVIPGLMRRFHEATEANAESVTIWGTGSARRDFLHVDDLAAGLLYLLQLETPPDLVNIGSGDDISIGELAHLIAEVTGFKGEILNDTSKPDGTPVKRMDTTIINRLGWTPAIGLKEGLAATYEDFKDGPVRAV